MSAFYRLAAAVLILSGQGSSVALAQDHHHHHPVGAPAAPAASSSALAHPFHIGAMEAWALRDRETALPVGGAKTPWKVHQNYALDLVTLRYGKVDDGTMEFSKAKAAPKTKVAA